MKTIGKTSTLMENLLQQGGSEVSRDSDKLLSHLQMQSACLNSLDKALESVTDLSIALACNLQLASSDFILKVCASHLQEHNFNKLRRTGFKSADLFCPTTLDQIQKKQYRSPKRLKGDSRQSFQWNNRSDDRLLAPSFFVASKKNTTRSPTSRLPQVAGATDASDYLPLLHGGHCSGTGRYGSLFIVIQELCRS